jgi:hypothetical protein
MTFKRSRRSLIALHHSAGAPHLRRALSLRDRVALPHPISAITPSFDESPRSIAQ